VADGVAAPGPVFAAGISNGAFLAEHLARHASLPVAGIALVAGSATVVSRRAVPVPSQGGDQHQLARSPVSVSISWMLASMMR